MSTNRRYVLAWTCSLMAGCSINVNPPLLFGDQTTYGLHLGTDPASAGGSVALGYKARSLAVVPVSVLQPDGKAGAIRSKEGKDASSQDADALSVFAVFENTAQESATLEAQQGNVRLGQVFATGVAAQVLTRGYQCRHAPTSKSCATTTSPAAPTTPTTAPATASAAAATTFKPAPAATAASGTAEAKPAGGERPFQSPLVFLRTDVVGIDIGGSIAEQGLRFVLGYDTDSVALIPPAAKNGDGALTSLFGTGEGRTDAYSVLGQFKSATATRGLNLGLERYFATGIAARNLAAGFAAAIATTPAATAAAPASAPAP